MTTNNFAKRLAWEKVKFDDIENWLDAHSVPVKATKRPVGKLGKPVGAGLTIEGTFQGGKDNWLLVTKVDGAKLAAPLRISAHNLDPLSPIPTNTVCRFKGMEKSDVVQNRIDPKTGRTQEAASGRHLDFLVIEVLAPKGVKISVE